MRSAKEKVMVACAACGRVVRARPNGNPYPHTPKDGLRGKGALAGRNPPKPSFCDGSRYRGYTP